MDKQEEDIQLDFLKAEPATNDDKTIAESVFAKTSSHKRRSKGVIIAVALIIFFISALVYVKVSASPVGLGISSTGWLTTLKHLISNDDKIIAGETQDRINLLLLGMGGAGHDGAYLTDTIILASLKPSSKQVALVSIPRDLYVEIEDYGWRRINHANAFGETDNYPGGGGALAAATVNQIIGQEIPYWLRIDFSGFKKLIDDLGGVDVYVAQSFTDANYPDYEHGIQTITFTEGQQHFNGEEALRYARSRHGTNGQGSDFSRSRRQMEIILAVKDKIMSAGTLLNPAKLSDLYNNLTQNINTNIRLWEALRFANLAKGIRQSDIINKVIDNSTTGLLTSYISDTGAYVLTTRSGNFSGIHELFANIFQTEEVKKEQTNIIIYNGTNVTGLASEIASTLSNDDFKIIDIGNAPTRDWDNTIIYNLTADDKPNSANHLVNILNATINKNLPFNIQEKILYDNPDLTSLSSIDFVVILGADQNL